MSKYADIAQQHAQLLIDMMGKGTSFLPYIAPGHGFPVSHDRPYNPLTGKPYRGGNMLTCMVIQIVRELPDNRWMTYKQAQSIGAQVKKGAKAVPLRYVVSDTVSDDKGATLQRNRPVFFQVFNGSQIDGLPEIEQRPIPEMKERHEMCEKLLSESGVTIHNDQKTNTAFYRPKEDAIYLPPAGIFVSPDVFYATALHELAHATGHPSRLDRDMSGARNSVSYAREEIIAETASHIMGMELGIGHDPSQHAAYIEQYIQVLKEDPAYVFKAASQAERICDYLGIERYQHKPLAPEQEIETPPALERTVVAPRIAPEVAMSM